MNEKEADVGHLKKYICLHRISRQNNVQHFIAKIIQNMFCNVFPLPLGRKEPACVTLYPF